MDPKIAKKRIQDLVKAIKRYDQAYFQEAQPLISDYEYDLLLKELEDLEERFPIYKATDSPTQHVGESLSKYFPSVAHLHPMHSLGNTYHPEEIVQFITRVEKQLESGLDLGFFCELKVDGVALSLHYLKGKLQRIVTRGDGVTGDDITANSLLLQDLPHHIELGENFPDLIEIRGEAFMRKSIFAELNKRYAREGKPLLANPRNATAGLLRTKYIDPKLGREAPLSFSPYAMLGDGLSIPTQQAVLKRLYQVGFTAFSPSALCPGLAEIEAYIAHWEANRAILPMMIDGIVIKVNSLAHQSILGSTAKHPRWAIAYKYKPDEESTVLEDVSFQVGRTGAITPVAHLKPVTLGGTQVSRASLYNAEAIKRLGLKRGDHLFVVKGGDVIPKVTHRDERYPNSSGLPITFPEHCPDCHTVLVQAPGEAVHYCPNHQSCPTQLKKKIAHAAQRDALNITSLGDKTIDLLFESGLVRSLVDCFQLEEAVLAGLPGFQAQSAANLVEGLRAAKRAPFAKVLYSLGIRYVGLTVADKLTAHFKDIEALMGASVEELLGAPEVGEKIAQSLLAYFNAPAHRVEINKLREIGFIFESEAKEAVKGPLAGRVFVVSGLFSHYTRSGIKDYISQHGGRSVSALSSHVDFLVTGEQPGPKKLVRAKELSLSIINEDDLIKMVGEPHYLKK